MRWLRKHFGPIEKGYAVYSLRHPLTQREYIGMSKDVEDRLRDHAENIRHKRYSRYGVDLFLDVDSILDLKLEILGRFKTRHACAYFEDSMIKTRKPAYNVGEDGRGNHEGLRDVMSVHGKKTRHFLGPRSDPKPVRCVTTGEVFPSISDAAKRYGCTPANVSKNCRHICHNTAGLLFEFAEARHRKGLPKRATSTCWGRVLCVTTGEIFKDSKGAREKYDIPSSTLSQHLSGKFTHARGLVFKRLPNENGLLTKSPSKGRLS